MLLVPSVFALAMFMMGYACTSFLPPNGRLLDRAALALGLGLLINYSLVLTGQPLRWIFAGEAVLALWGIWRFGADAKDRLRVSRLANGRTLAVVGCIMFTLAIYYVEILSEPVYRWDARVIWFFHGKMIWSEGALNARTGLNHPSVDFSSPAYPNLVPAIAGQIAYLKGFWNEFFPKTCLAIILLPLLLWVLSFARRRLTYVLLFLVFFFSLDGWLSNGYMDGYFAMYCGVSLLSFGRFFIERNDADLYSGICTLGIVAGMKNEGLLFVLCVLASLFVVSWWDREGGLGRFLRRIRTDRLLLTVLVLSAAPTIMWMYWKAALGLNHPLTADPSGALARISQRLSDGFSARYLLEFLTLQATAIWLLALLFAATLVFSLLQKLRLHRGALVAGMTSVMYSTGLYVTYLSTPAGLHYHVTTSAIRTMATASFALFVGLYFLLSNLEARAYPGPPVPARNVE